MFDRYQEEMDYEFNARYDYIAELAAEHRESDEALEYEAQACYAEWQAEQAAFIGPPAPRPVYEDDIPF
jgi:hypothetical protein